MTGRLKTGLPNFGNTCYINAVLQCLRYSKPLVYMLREHRVEAKPNDKKDQLLESFVELLFADCAAKDLHVFIRNLAYLQRQFSLLRQCDSHELYLYIIDTFFEKYPKKFVNPYKGSLESTVTCLSCSHESITCFPFISLSLEMETSQTPQKVSDLLLNFQKDEFLEDMIDCDKCCIKRKSKKKLCVKELPKLLVIHLKRFNGMRKNNSPIYIDKFIQVNGKKFRLFGLCNHSGTMNGGHYTATCRRRDSMWAVCNDNIIQKISDLPHSTPVAYILFFEAI